MVKKLIELLTIPGSTDVNDAIDFVRGQFEKKMEKKQNLSTYVIAARFKKDVKVPKSMYTHYFPVQLGRSVPNSCWKKEKVKNKNYFIFVLYQCHKRNFTKHSDTRTWHFFFLQSVTLLRHQKISCGVLKWKLGI